MGANFSPSSKALIWQSVRKCEDKFSTGEVADVISDGLRSWIVIDSSWLSVWLAGSGEDVAVGTSGGRVDGVVVGCCWWSSSLLVVVISAVGTEKETATELQCGLRVGKFWVGVGSGTLKSWSR